MGVCELEVAKQWLVHAIERVVGRIDGEAQELTQFERFLRRGLLLAFQALSILMMLSLKSHAMKSQALDMRYSIAHDRILHDVMT